MKQYMVIETFRPGSRDEVYERFRRQGRMLPDGLVYLDSWLEEEEGGDDPNEAATVQHDG